MSEQQGVRRIQWALLQALYDVSGHRSLIQIQRGQLEPIRNLPDDELGGVIRPLRQRGLINYTIEAQELYLTDKGLDAVENTEHQLEKNKSEPRSVNYTIHAPNANIGAIMQGVANSKQIVDQNLGNVPPAPKFEVFWSGLQKSATVQLRQWGVGAYPADVELARLYRKWPAKLQLIVENTGTKQALGTQVTITLPARIERAIIGEWGSPHDNWSSVGGNRYRCALGDLNAGDACFCPPIAVHPLAINEEYSFDIVVTAGGAAIPAKERLIATFELES